MLPLKRILCPTDFSDPSNEALKIANELARHFSSEVVLLHVVQPMRSSVTTEPHTGFDMFAYLESIKESAQKALKGVKDKKLAKAGKVRSVIIEGDPAEEIIKAAAGEKVNLIVIATHGRSGWKRFVFGSVAEKVIRLSTCAVLTIRAPREEE
jgi:nucleotide-binding universal stress UspA family protein